MIEESVDPRITPWQIDESEFYELESRREELEFLLRYAVLAPSSRNTQPWSFRITANSVEIFADYSRRTPAIDPDDRELLMSVGAAITNLRVAAAWFGFDSAVHYEQRPQESFFVALVTFQETCSTDENLRRLFPAIRRRHTNRQPFEATPLEFSALGALCDLADQFPDTVTFLLPRDKRRLGNLVALGNELQMSRTSVRAELADWIRGSESDSEDGICVDGLGIPAPLDRLAGWVTRHVDLGGVQAAHDRQMINNAAALMLISANDDRVSLLTAGEVVERLLLTATLNGLQYSFFNYAIEDSGLREEIRRLARSIEPPQLLLRVGYAKPVARAMPRRPVESVMQKPALD